MKKVLTSVIIIALSMQIAWLHADAESRKNNFGEPAGLSQMINGFKAMPAEQAKPILSCKAISSETPEKADPYTVETFLMSFKENPQNSLDLRNGSQWSYAIGWIEYLHGNDIEFSAALQSWHEALVKQTSDRQSYWQNNKMIGTNTANYHKGNLEYYSSETYLRELKQSN